MTDQRPVRRVQPAPGHGPGSGWPDSIPAVAQVLREGLELPAGVTFLVGENGSGKSTLIEAIAAAYGLNPEGGSQSARHATRPTESDLAQRIVLARSPGRPSWGYFVRAETAHGLYTYLEENPGVRDSVRYHERSHGEGMLALIGDRLGTPGFFVLDEPESALSFKACLGMVALLDDLRREGSQVLVATHSPLLTALPGATIFELGPHGIRPAAYDELDLVAHWRSFLDEPDRYLGPLLD